MGEAQRAVGPDSDRLTWSEICARYPGEWVTMVDADWLDDDHLDFRTAVVAVHSPDYATSFLARELRSRFDESIHLFTGPCEAPSSWAR